ncbi:MAG: hypothetical protein HC824_11105 [Synechococcales cyanobacterium RM1_1_8]|nr:hypothetical protein [Synechococcales cyanobacterium RM1_1_8]
MVIKLIELSLGLLLIGLIIRLLQTFLPRQVKDTDLRYRLRKVIGNDIGCD